MVQKRLFDSFDYSAYWPLSLLCLLFEFHFFFTFFCQYVNFKLSLWNSFFEFFYLFLESTYFFVDLNILNFYIWTSFFLMPVGTVNTKLACFLFIENFADFWMSFHTPFWFAVDFFRTYFIDMAISTVVFKLAVSSLVILTNNFQTFLKIILNFTLQIYS